MGTGRVFILGAGFSKQAGLPLASELTTCVLDEMDTTKDDEFQTWLRYLRERVVALEGGDERYAVNIEALFDFAKYDEEWLRMKQQLVPVGRRDGPGTPWNTAEDIRTWLECMEEAIPRVLRKAQKAADLDPIGRFTANLTDDDTIVTFNYDTLVEQALSDQSTPWDHGLRGKTDGSVSILKMHGSIDWLLLRRRPEAELSRFIKLFSKTDVNAPSPQNATTQKVQGGQLGLPDDGNGRDCEPEYDWELWRAKDAEGCAAVLDMDECGLNSFDYRLGLAGFGQHKPLHKLVGSARTWDLASEMLTVADDICVVGFSLSPYDNMTRAHFAAMLRIRERPPPTVTIVDPNAFRLADAYRAVFGDTLKLVAKPAEGVDWQELLA